MTGNDELALVLRGLEQFGEAVQCHDATIAIEPDNAAWHHARGETLVSAGDAASAVDSFRRAVTLKPDFADAWASLGWALRLIGQFEASERCFQQVRDIDPRHVGGYGQRAAHGPGSDDAGELDRLVQMIERSDSRLNERITAGFGLGRLLDSAGRFDEAFAYYAAANALVRANWPAGADRFIPENFAHWVDLLIETYASDSFDDRSGRGNPSELPVFIVGMPRSGTTLLEQICASHSKVFGAGELHDIDRIATALAPRDGAIVRRETDFAAAMRHADDHVARLRRLGGDALRVIDKMPDNIMQVGMVANLFPRTRIIYCQRDPRDTALSCYFQLFSDGLMHFSYDLADCGWRTRQTDRLGQHWLGVLPQRVMPVCYEDLIGDLEGQSRRLIDFLGLAWEPACLDFHRTERTVATASHWQVRQPIYTSSVERWRHYERYLTPMLATLGDSGTT